MVASLGLLGAVPARANNDFANGFEDQMGRLLALEASQIGRLVLSSGLHTHVAHYATAWPQYSAARYYDGYGVDARDPFVSHWRTPRGPARRHHGHHTRHHRYADHDRDHRVRYERSDRRRHRDD